MTGNALLTATERRVLDAVCEAFCPRLEAGPGEHEALFALGAPDVDLSGAVARAMATLGARQQKELRLFLRLLDSRVFMSLATRRGSGFSALDTRGREAALLALAPAPLAAQETSPVAVTPSLSGPLGCGSSMVSRIGRSRTSLAFRKTRSARRSPSGCIACENTSWHAASPIRA